MLGSECLCVCRFLCEGGKTYRYGYLDKVLSVTDGDTTRTYTYHADGQLASATVGADLQAARVAPQTEDYSITTFTFDDVNQLVSSTTDGVTTRYTYDAAGRLVTEGNKTYRYGYLDKVMSVSEGDKTYTYMYYADGQLARAKYVGNSEEFLWDGLALVRRNDEHFVNEPHVGGGNPVASSKGTSYFNDILGTTVGFKSNGKYSPAALTAFGERLDNVDSTSPAIRSLGEGWFTGKPFVEGLGHAFLMRNYRASLAKWQTADPIGYPDGWNQLAYCGNGVVDSVDLWGCQAYDPNGLTEFETEALYRSLLAWTTYAWAGYAFVAWQDKQNTLQFLTRYLLGQGDQILMVRDISDNAGFSGANRKAKDKILEGERSFDIATVFSGDWYTALGQVSVHYEVVEYDDQYVAFASFEDTYDFHDIHFNAPFDGLSLVGLVFGWYGGDWVKDVWMKNLADNGWATVFKTTCEWVFYIQKE